MSSLRAQYAIPVHQVHRANPCPRTAILRSGIFCFARERGALVGEHPNQSLRQNSLPGSHMRASLGTWYASASYSKQHCPVSRPLAEVRLLQPMSKDAVRALEFPLQNAASVSYHSFCDVQIGILQASHSLTYNCKKRKECTL